MVVFIFIFMIVKHELPLYTGLKHPVPGTLVIKRLISVLSTKWTQWPISGASPSSQNIVINIWFQMCSIELTCCKSFRIRVLNSTYRYNWISHINLLDINLLRNPNVALPISKFIHYQIANLKQLAKRCQKQHHSSLYFEKSVFFIS